MSEKRTSRNSGRERLQVAMELPKAALATRRMVPLRSLSSRPLSQSGHSLEHVSPRVRLRRRLELISAAFKSYQSTRHRDAVYEYLRPVYRTVLHYRLRRKARFLRQFACSVLNISKDKMPDVFTVCIRATCGDAIDAKCVSKWSRALRYSAFCKVEPKNLKTFIRQHGSINGCADRYTRIRSRQTGRKSRRQ